MLLEISKKKYSAVEMSNNVDSLSDKTVAISQIKIKRVEYLTSF